MNLFLRAAAHRANIRRSALVCAFAALGAVALALAGLSLLELYGFRRAVELFLIFVLLTYFAYLARGRLRDGIIILCSLVAGLGALEIFALKSETMTFPVQGKGFSVSKPGLGWGPAGPGHYPARKTDPRTGTVIYDVAYTIDDSLLRKTNSAREGQAIAFFGDSFTFGQGVNDDETMPQAFADLSGRAPRVLNLGFPGYGPQHVLYALETGTYDAALGPDPQLFISLTVPWHAERAACKAPWTLRAPRYELENSSVTLKGTCSEGPNRLLSEWLEGSALYRVAIKPYRQRIDHDDVELYVSILLAAVDKAREKYGVRTLIPYIAAGDFYLRGTGFTDAMIIRRLKEGGAIVVDATLAREEKEGAVIGIPGDGHPTPFAHRARARAIKELIEQEWSVAGIPSPI
jgi:hypothetical protein